MSLLVAMSLFSMFFFISLYMQQVLGYSAIKAGVSYLPLALTIILAAGLALQQAGVVINRKMLAELAVNDKAAFVQLTETAKKALA